MKKIFFAGAILLSLCCFMTASAQNKKLQPLYSVHGTEWKIYLSERVSAPEMQAAEELARVLGMLGVHKKQAPEIIHINKRPVKNGIIIGSLESPLISDMADELKLKKSDDDEIAQYIIGENIFLAGNSPRATLFSVYDFMQRVMGVRWLWYGEDGEFMPLKRDLYLKEMAYNFIPTFRYRNVSLAKGWERQNWAARNFSQEGDFRFGGERYYGAETIQPWRSDYKEHPEYFALIKGERYLPPPTGWSWVINGCWSNEDFTQLCLERIRDGIRKTNANHISLHPADSLARCECEECAKMIDPDKSSRWFKYNARLIRELKKDFPDLKYSVLAYQEYREVPAAPVEEVIFVEYAQYDRCFVHKFDYPNCPVNKKSLGRLKRWIEEKGVPMGIYGYEFDVFQPAMYMPLWELIADEMKFFRDNKLIKAMTEWGPGEQNRLSRYAYLQLAWNPDLSADEVLTDWCRTAYGPGEKAMFKYHKASATIWNSMPLHLSNCFNNPIAAVKLFLTPEFITLADESFEAAEKAINKLKDESLKKKYLHSVSLDKKDLAEWKILLEKAMKDNVRITAPKLTSDNDFSEGATLAPFKKRHNFQEEPLKTDGKIYWTDDALHIQINCQEPNMLKDVPPKLEKDDSEIFAHNDTIEIFLQPEQNGSYYHLTFNRSGASYDAEVLDNKWNADWTFDVQAGSHRWLATVKIPFKSLGVTPSPNDTWKLIVIRGSKPAPSGFPLPLYHEMGAGADIVFIDGKRPE